MRTMPTTTAPTGTATSTAGPAPTPAPAPAAPRAPLTWPGQAILADPVTAAILHATWSGDPAVVVPSPPGAGKTRLVALLAAALAGRAGLRVGIAAQTRDQAVELARRLAALTDTAALIWATKGPKPDTHGTRVVSGANVRYPATGGAILIATTARWLYADPASVAADVMIVDEAWQQTYADLGALGAYSAQVVAVGDPGQIDPVVTGSTARWATSPTGPHLPAPDALLAAHGDAVATHTLRHTWRLGPATTALIQPTLYPGLPFTSRRPPEHLTDPTGTVLPELAHHPVTVTAGPGDPALITACADRVRALLTTHLHTTTGQRPVTDHDLAVVCPHVTQAAAVRAALSDHPHLLVGTANQLQGLERHAVVALHPLTGHRDATGFATDTGRACVMLTRHRTHLTVVLDAHTPTVLAAAPTDDPDADTHRTLIAALLATPAA